MDLQNFDKMGKVLEKVERRLGEKLLLKGDRCVGPKCAFTRRSYPPGVHGKTGKKRKRNLSEFGELMREKQKIRFLYGLDDKILERYYKKAYKKARIFADNFFRMLESRLDNTVFRLGFAESRRIARQFVSHGHILVNEKTVTIPSYQIRRGDTISIKEAFLNSPVFVNLETKLKKYEPPKWLQLDIVKKIGAVIGLPETEGQFNFDIAKIKEFYSR